MSRGLVSQKQYSRKKRKQSFSKILNRSGIQVPEFKISDKIKNIMSRGLCYCLIIICGILFLVKSLFFRSEQRIGEIKISDNTLATYQDIELFNMISNNVKGKYFYSISSNKNQLLNKVQETFPFVGDIQFYLEDEDSTAITGSSNRIAIGIELPEELPIYDFQIINADFPIQKSKEIPIDGGATLGVQIQYYEPKILVQLNDKKFAIWDESTYVEIQEGTLLGTKEDGSDLFTIETPQYLSGTTSIDGFFFELKLDDFLQISELAQNDFPTMKRFVYLAGSTRFIIFTDDDKMLYFNFPEGCDISEQRNLQINKYNLLKNEYSNFKNLQTIDLGSLEENKVIIK